MELCTAAITTTIEPIAAMKYVAARLSRRPLRRTRCVAGTARSAEPTTTALRASPEIVTLAS